MATSTAAAAFATTGSAVRAPVRDASALASSSTFGTSLVQLGSVGSPLKQSNKLVATRAALSEEQKSAGRKLLASLVATGAALSIAGQALAGNPVDFAKSKADDVVSSSQDAASNLPNIPNIELPKGGALEEAKNAADSFVNETRSRIDGIFGKNKPYPQNRVASTNGGTGSAVGDAKKRISNFGAKNPIAENVNKATDDTKNTIAQAQAGNTGSARAGREFLGQDSTRVDDATKKVQNLGDSFKNKANDAVNEAKGFVGSAQSATPELPSFPNPLDKLNLNNAEDLKGKAADAKDSLTSNLPSAPDMPNLPNPFEGLTNGKVNPSFLLFALVPYVFVLRS